jgi:5-formyltetrahydrofolate cyclo-ligase
VERLRRSARARRGALDDATIRSASRAVAELARPLLADAPSIGAYVAVRGEVDPAPIVEWAWAQSTPVFVPRVAVGHTMVFAQWQPGGEHHLGAFGIPEPGHHARIRPAARLAAVLVPVVAFDRRGSRLGTGAGFYDRAFEFRRHQARGSAPVLIGLAYAWQEVEALERQSWDVPLDFIVTEAEVIRASTD